MSEQESEIEYGEGEEMMSGEEMEAEGENQDDEDVELDPGNLGLVVAFKSV